MPLLIQRIARGLRPTAFHPDRPPATRGTPDRIVLGAKASTNGSAKPPVRIFLGTERGQFRAERVFIWSVEKFRDPARIYEIYLMRDLAGFKRRFWLTGFTNYRFAIPEFADFEGRAIYNDTDQIYLKDPALLFDTPMNGAGFLSINDRDTSVMLIDCKRMREVWNPRDVRRLDRKALEKRARQGRLWGELDGGWNARDSEYHPERSHLVHFTTLHTQPWQPFPAEFVYFDNPTDPLWPDLEAEADRHRFLPVKATCPSPAWPKVFKQLPDQNHQRLLATYAPPKTHDELKISNLLERVPDADLPWVLDRLFGLADRLSISIREPRRHGSEQTRRSLWFWQQQLINASRLNPETVWSLDYKSPGGKPQTLTGGPAPEGAIVVLVHHKPGHANQSRALAHELAGRSGRAVREVTVDTTETAFFVQSLFGRPQIPDPGSDAAVIVAGGWLPTRVARRIQKAHPHLRLILSGRKAGPPGDPGTVIIQCQHFGLPPHPNRLLTRLPLNAGITQVPQTSNRWRPWLDADRSMALLLGGNSRSHEIRPESARNLARDVSALAARENASLMVVGSRRSETIMAAVEEGLTAEDLRYHWRPDDPENPYSLALKHADLLIVTGESESMLADAASRGRIFVIWPTPARPKTLWGRFSQEVADRAVRPRMNRRGSIRPQQGQTYLCARALERGWVIPPRDMEALHTRLLDDQVAVTFGDPVPETFHRRENNELSATVERIAALLQIGLKHC